MAQKANNCGCVWDGPIQVLTCGDHNVAAKNLNRAQAQFTKLELELDQAVKDGNRLADALVKSREEAAQLKLQIEELKKKVAEEHSDYLQEHHAHYSEAELREARDKEIERLSLGIHEHTTYPEPLINGSAVDSAIALIKDRKEKIRLNDELRKALSKIDAMRKRLPDPDFNEQRNTVAGIAEIIQVALAEKRICESVSDLRRKCELPAGHNGNHDGEGGIWR